MIGAMANAAAVFGEPEWLEAAETAFRFVAETMQADGRLHHSHRDGRTKHAATLDDYAAMARAALALHEVTGDPGLPRPGAGLGRRARCALLGRGRRRLFPHRRRRRGADRPHQVGRRRRNPVRQRPRRGGAGAPRAGHRRGALPRPRRGPDRRLLGPDKPQLLPAGHADERKRAADGGRADRDCRRTRRRRTRGPSSTPRSAHPAVARVVTVVEPGTELPQSHPAHGKGAVDGRAAAYVCVGQTCSLPATDAEGLAAAMARG